MSDGNPTGVGDAGDLQLLGPAAADRLAGLVFELASQLHEERVRRLALEDVLTRAGLLDTAALEAVVEDSAFRDRSRAQADDSIRRLLRIVTEHGTPEGPLRAEAPTAESGETA